MTIRFFLLLWYWGGVWEIIAISHSVLDTTTKQDQALSVSFPMFYFPCVSAHTAFIPPYVRTHTHSSVCSQFCLPLL